MPLRRLLLPLIIVLIAAVLAGVLLDGVEGIMWPTHQQWPLIFELRLPRALTAAVSGALLACAGAAVQYQFRNALAEPGLIGVSGGAALAAACALQLAASPALVSISAFGGAIGALFLVWRLAGSGSASTQLILTGIAINALASSLLMLLIATLPDGTLRNVTFWLMGSFAASEWRTAISLLIALPLIWLTLWRHWRYLNLLQLGENAAYYAGYRINRWRLSTILLASLATALVVSQCGIVGFIGLMAPHLCRLAVGGDARRVLLLSPLAGALLASIADTIARLALYPAELPVGVITSLAGAPFFLWLLRRSRNRRDNADIA